MDHKKQKGREDVHSFSCFNIFKDKSYQGGDSSSNGGKPESGVRSVGNNLLRTVADPRVDIKAGEKIAEQKGLWQSQSQSQDPSNYKIFPMEIRTTAGAAPGADCEGYQK
uniref:Uncharacterized protein n=1 Tax=Fagus sylvatica TaxID=28930 RepID=A0A2N9GTL0_FAGSY